MSSPGEVVGERETAGESVAAAPLRMKVRNRKDSERSVLTGRVSAEDERAFRSELFRYRYESVALLQKYLRVSLDLGRLPSVLGGEMFRAKVTSYKVSSFEDLVIFVTDMSACFNRLSEVSKKFISLHVFQEHSLADTAAMIGCDRVTSWRIYCDALDEASEVLLRFGMIESMDWIGDQVAAEGWFEGCPVLRRNASSAATGLPPKKPSMRVDDAPAPKVQRRDSKMG